MTLDKIKNMTRKDFENALEYDRNAGFSDADTRSAKWRFETMCFLTKKEALSVWRDSAHAKIAANT